MRVYYVFTIKDSLLDYYYERPYSLYKLLEQIYKLKNNDIVLGYNLLNEVTNSFNIYDMDNYIYKKHYNMSCYRKMGENHILMNKDNETILKVYNSHIRISTDEEYSRLLNTISEYNSNMFVCDFKNEDFFWLRKIRSKTIV